MIIITIVHDEDYAPDNVEHEFKGDELTSPEQQAILFLKEIDKEDIFNGSL